MKKVILWLPIFVCAIFTKGQEILNKKTEIKSAPVQISLQFKGEKNSKDKISVTFWKDHVYGRMLNGSTNYIVKADRNGKFKIDLPAIDHPGRISIFDWAHNNVVNLQLIEPGDVIQVAVQNPESDTEESIIKFSGEGAAKFECSKAVAINPITDYQVVYNRNKNYHKSLKAADSLLRVKLKVMERYKNKISSFAYHIIKADVIGSVYQMISGMIRPKAIDNNIEPGNPVYEKKLQEIFSELQIRADTMDEEALILSINYIDFLYSLSKLEFALSDNKKRYAFKPLYDQLKSNYSGIVREKLLVHLLFNSSDMYTLFLGVDPDTYTECLKDAIALTQTPYLKEALSKRLETRGKGATALDFRLPADSSGRMISLSDLKGKVILVDMWGHICTACYLFSQSFHEKVYPKFKDNSDFVVVSVMLDTYAGKDNYIQRLRGEGKYTSPEYINLYAGNGEAMGQLIRDHYNVDAVPLLLLIDKDGKIYSSTPPFFTDTSNSREIEELTALIKKALSSQAVR